MKIYEKPDLYFIDENGESKKLEILDFSELEPVDLCDDYFLTLLNEPLEMTFELKYLDLNMKMCLLGKVYWVGKVPKKYKGEKHNNGQR